MAESSENDNENCPHGALQGSVGAPGMAGAELADALKQRALFVYCGHGAGQQHLPGRALRRQRACAASLLMGCSSGHLGRTGQHYEPSGPILAYLLAGARTPASNLPEEVIPLPLHGPRGAESIVNTVPHNIQG